MNVKYVGYTLFALLTTLAFFVEFSLCKPDGDGHI